MTKKMISLIIPVFNESDILSSAIDKVHDYFEALKIPYEIIFVNDGSTDNSIDIIRNCNKTNIHLISYAKNRGKGYALRTGIKNSRGDIVFFTDCDTAYGLDVIAEAIKIFERTNTDIVIGSRRLNNEGYKNYSFLRHISSSIFSFIVNLILRLSLSDTQCGFKGFQGDCARNIFSQCKIDGFGIDFEVLYLANKMGYSIEQMPVSVLYHSNSSVHIVRDSLRMLRELFIVRKLHK